jgi:hypothetical protein
MAGSRCIDPCPLRSNTDSRPSKLPPALCILTPGGPNRAICPFDWFCELIFTLTWTCLKKSPILLYRTTYLPSGGGGHTDCHGATHISSFASICFHQTPDTRVTPRSGGLASDALGASRLSCVGRRVLHWCQCGESGCRARLAKVA